MKSKSSKPFDVEKDKWVGHGTVGGNESEEVETAHA